MVNKWSKFRQFLRLKGRCLVCGEAPKTVPGLCNSCDQKIQRIERPCYQCGEPMHFNPSSHKCGHCQSSPPAFDHSVSPLLYSDPLRQLHLNFKFHQDLAAGNLLANLLYDSLSHSNAMPQLLVPIPLHAERMRERGFDQALEIAKVLARRLQIPFHSGLLVRKNCTQPQSGLSRAQRHKNLRNAFILTQPLPVKHVALVDDIMTTGSTFNAAAQLMKTAGVKTVEVWAVGRSTRDE
ncbi:hypothetical protein BOW39_07905 [Solemya velum gill symbiont]|uniref:ComF family protein n=1 Tax=Solemya velum gill symbiont TaxID=2340 RepID=UPI000997CDA3|nr:ComF family protein [Solemya velum gill symbiont]OOZ49008.1 hypothetical protein BOW39_07905 [Solemya velum gill symbiont]